MEKLQNPRPTARKLSRSKVAVSVFSSLAIVSCTAERSSLPETANTVSTNHETANTSNGYTMPEAPSKEQKSKLRDCQDYYGHAVTTPAALMGCLTGEIKILPAAYEIAEERLVQVACNKQRKLRLAEIDPDHAYERSRAEQADISERLDGLRAQYDVPANQRTDLDILGSDTCPEVITFNRPRG